MVPTLTTAGDTRLLMNAADFTAVEEPVGGSSQMLQDVGFKK
jgi:hypothetical protein